MVALAGGAVLLLTWFWAQYVPGYVVSRLLIPGARGLERHMLALVCGLSLVPLAIFIVSLAGGIPMDGSLILACATAVNVVGLGSIGPALWKQPDVGRKDILALFGTFAAVTLFILFGFRGIDAGDVLTSIQHCLYVIALHGIHNDPSTSLPLYDHLTGEVMHFLIHHDSNRLSGLGELLYEQRLANVPVLGVPVATLGMAGWIASAIHAAVLTAIAAYLTAREQGASLCAAVIGAVIFTWGSQILSGYYVNENAYALGIVGVMVHAALRPQITIRRGILIGLLCGHLVGIRHPACLLIPAMVTAILWQSTTWRRRLITLGATGACALLTVAPWLYINLLKLGTMFTHPKVTPDSGGRVVQNALWGHTFMFKPLQWPFTDQVVRTVWNPFPTMLWIPLLVAHSFGQLALGLAAVGLRTGRTTVVLLLFAVPHTFAIGLLEGVDWEQITYIMPGLAPLPILIAAGVDRVMEKRHTLIVAGVIVVAIMSVTRGVRGVDFPVDPRILEKSESSAPLNRTDSTERVATLLTSVSPLPAFPKLRTEWATRLWETFDARLRLSTSVPIAESGLPLYPSGNLILLSAYSQGLVRSYEFSLDSRPHRPPETPFRTAVWLHTMAFQFDAQRLDVTVKRLQGRYAIDIKPVGKAGELRDFTFWLNPWYPPIESVDVKIDGEPTPDIRRLRYGGEKKYGEELFLVTNYPRELVDTIEVPFTIDPQGRPLGCGIWIFMKGVDGHHIATLSPGGAVDIKWDGQANGVLVLPRPLLATHLYLFSEPWCSSHVPQYGDRYGVAEGPFGAGQPIHITLDRMW